jgi:hypothetical protein
VGRKGPCNCNRVVRDSLSRKVMFEWRPERGRGTFYIWAKGTACEKSSGKARSRMSSKGRGGWWATVGRQGGT